MTDKPWPRPQVLLLDAMGTLIGLRQSVGATYAAVAARHGLQLSAEAVDRTFPAILRQAPPLAFPGLRGEELLPAEQTWWGERIAATLVACGAAPPPPALSRELFEAYADPSLWHVHDDVPERLERWQREGLRLAVVSNFDRRLHGLLEGLGLAGWLEHVVVSSEAGAAKPSPEPFLQALAVLGSSPARAWHIGDAPEDAEGARRAGIRCLIVRRR